MSIVMSSLMSRSLGGLSKVCRKRRLMVASWMAAFAPMSAENVLALTWGSSPWESASSGPGFCMVSTANAREVRVGGDGLKLSSGPLDHMQTRLCLLETRRRLPHPPNVDGTECIPRKKS